MAFQNIMDRVPGGNQVAVNIGKAQFILVFQEGDSHAFFEKTAEIFPAESGLTSHVIKGKRILIMVIYISDDLSKHIVRLLLPV